MLNVILGWVVFKNLINGINELLTFGLSGFATVMEISVCINLETLISMQRRVSCFGETA